MRRLTTALVVVVVSVCAGIGVYEQVRHREVAIERARQQRTPLQKAAHDIDPARRAGNGRHFAVVPERLPPGLVELYPLNDVMDDGVTDIYVFGYLRAVVKYTAVPGARPCGEHWRRGEKPARTCRWPVWLSRSSPGTAPAEKFLTMGVPAVHRSSPPSALPGGHRTPADPHGGATGGPDGSPSAGSLN